MKTFIDGAKHGIIYFSMGSIIEPSDFIELGNTFIQELKNFPQRVVMKWNPELLNEIPDNILVEKWISQTQVLGKIWPILVTYYREVYFAALLPKTEIIKIEKFESKSLSPVRTCQYKTFNFLYILPFVTLKAKLHQKQKTYKIAKFSQLFKKPILGRNF